MAVHNTFLAPVAKLLDDDTCPSAYLVADPAHPFARSNDGGRRAYVLPRRCELFIRFLRVPLIVTAASNIDVLCKNGWTRWAHLFHSPVSLHYVYQDSALDAYDIFFCVGPHQKEELEYLQELRGWDKVKTFELGYPKLDVITEITYLSRGANVTDRLRTIAFAPSWGANGILRSHGYEIVEGLLNEGFCVVLRPHKHSFDFDSQVLDRIYRDFGGEKFSIDDAPGFEGMIGSDLLISDWSGVAYEYAFSTGRPVIFVDVEGGRKVQSDKNRQLPLDAMEDVCRYEVGVVCRPGEIIEAVQKVANTGLAEWRDRIKAVQGKYFYNFGVAAQPIADAIAELARSTGPRLQ
jgi:YidC/Oxa1 family membrane protein insertase